MGANVEYSVCGCIYWVSLKRVFQEQVCVTRDTQEQINRDDSLKMWR